MSDGRKPRLKSLPGGKADPKPTPAPERDSPVDESPAPTGGAAAPEQGEAPMLAPTMTPPLPGTPSSRLPRRPASSEVLDPITTTGEFAAVHPVVRKKFGRYELLMQMGTGGMATLFLARILGPKKFEKLLAVKKIHEHLTGDAEFISMFRDEARIAALIHHPNVVATFDLGVIDDSYFIAMEYVHGQTLKDMINAARRRKDPLPWPIAVRIVSDVAKGLHAAHELRSHEGEPLGVIHRDVSPQNVLISYDGHVKLVDFGIAYAAEKLTDTGAGKLKGKVSYMSPEQASGIVVDRRSDIFSLGTVLFEAVTQQRLFKEATEAATLLQVRAARVPFLHKVRDDLPGELDVIVQCALARDREARFETAEELAEALDELLLLRKLRPGRKQLSGLMEDLFYERKRIKDRMVRRALANTTDTPLQGIEAIGDETSSSIQLETPGAEGALPGRGVSPVFYVLGTAGILLLAALVAMLAWPKRDPAKSPPTGPAPGTQAQGMRPPRPRPRPVMPQRPATASSVMLTIRVSPKRAKSTITFRSEVQQGPIFQAVLPPSSRREEVTITAKGYLPRTIPIVLAQALTLPVELLPDAETRKKRKRRKKKDMEVARPRPMSVLLEL
ncbi:MAG: protein kinase [bacterium]